MSEENRSLLVEKIEALAETRKISITVLEENLEIARGSIRRWRVNDPGISKIQLIADYFNVPPSYLIDDTQKLSDAAKVLALLNDSAFTDETYDDIMNYIEFIKTKKG
ncbi:helix-turn-helix domain-containing protein [Listeria cossartiae]|uniref:Helix-turn-helix transcriptional regulator n=1 Tax=Listeria cossartiae subsp. cayugensis TaxID=2713505 RepID=A0ABU2IIR7_9LIST|nr:MULTISPECIES: helix-turn-helix transcriptional regulator [Listeria]MBC1996751.1 helix-turn-helix transcriptional regulator [Listeria marthii]MBC2037891.1 helix-turn-helix transcriptional regulator [Listeria marthii]MBF2350116.1 helix-turn-helix transcriptional regulator [Listeria marthii]MCD2225551.1 helix-turn-helix domain-containing protein [Listeria cossartiae]MCD2240302.1 helix-turn-helix domain-containing protein [Listeria cossartiae]